MSTTQVQLRRGPGNTINTFIGASGEIVVNTDTNQIVVNNGVTPGGITGSRIIDLNNLSGYLSRNINFHSGLIVDNYNKISVDYTYRFLDDQYSIPSVGYNYRFLYDGSAAPAIDWGNRIAFDLNGYYSIDWQNKILQDSQAIQSINWDSRNLIDFLGNISLDWSGNSLFKNWNIQSGYFSESIGLNPSNKNSNISLSNKPFYINTGAAISTWTLPLINTCTGRTYQLKNCGNQVTITGVFPNQIFAQYPVDNFVMNSGEAYQFANNGLYWCVM